jgi:hypothetical protein
VAAGVGGGLVDAQQPPDELLDPRTQGEQGGDRPGADGQGDGHVGGVVGADGHPAQGDQQGRGAGDQQGQQAQGLGLGGVVERLDDGPVD